MINRWNCAGIDFRKTTDEQVAVLLKAYPAGASTGDMEHNLPLHLALRSPVVCHRTIQYRPTRICTYVCPPYLSISLSLSISIHIYLYMYAYKNQHIYIYIYMYIYMYTCICM